MRYLTFSFIKNCKLKSLCHQLITRHVADSVQYVAVEGVKKGESNYVEVAPSWKCDERPELRSAVVQDMQVYPEFVSEQEEKALMAELEPQLRRMRYEFDHWDNAIQGYRETERTKWNDENSSILARVREIAFAKGSGSGEPLPHTHVLDLAAAGHIKPHVDSVRFCGEVIAGVCLLSSAVMRLQHCAAACTHLALDVLLERRCLYVMRGIARYEFSHAVLGGERSLWRGTPLPRLRRVAVILRSRPSSDAPTPTPTH